MSNETTEQNFMQLSDDGFISIDANQNILQINQQACRLLGIQHDQIIGTQLSQITKSIPVWAEIIDACNKGTRHDQNLTLNGGQQVFISLRSQSHTQNIQLIQICDLAGFEYRRNRANGRKPDNVISFLSNKTRPDFETQRRLSPELNRVLARGERAIRQGARVMITGESGVGKSEIARFLHIAVSDANDPFKIVNCAMSSPADLTDILFGTTENTGLIQQATGGTLFLDEIAEIPLSVQARLLGYLEDFSTNAANSQGAHRTSLRIISATNADLQKLINEGKFRADLFYRLAVISLRVPPLRQMPAMIPHLCDRFMQTINQRRETPIILSGQFLKTLEDYSFPGNIRELLNIVQRASIFMEDAQDMEELIAELIRPNDNLHAIELTNGATLDLKTEVKRFELALIDKAILIHGSKRKAAKILGVDIGTISRKTTKREVGEEAENLDLNIKK